MLVYCDKYPRLRVHDLGVRFEDGKAEVSDPQVLDKLRKVEHVRVPETKPKKK